MTSEEQEKFVLSYVQEWAGSNELALTWYASEVIPALNRTAKEAVDGGDFEAVKQYLEHIRDDGFA